MGTCKNKKLIGPYLDGQLGECRWLDEHISECSQCLIEYETIQKMNHLAGKLDLAPPESHYWKNFSARTMARIATSEARTVKSRSWLFFTGYKMPIRIIGLAAAVVLVVGISFMFGGNSQDSQVTQITQNKSNDLIAMSSADTAAVSSPPRTQTVEINDMKSGPYLADNSLGVSDSPIDVNALEAISTGFQNIDPNPSLQGQFRYIARNRVDLIEPDLPAGTGTIQSAMLEPNTDMVIVYQINQGSKAGEIPLMVYRQATVKYFGPDKAMPWRNIDRLTIPNWGFAAGNRQTDEQANKRLNMELDLSQDK